MNPTPIYTQLLAETLHHGPFGFLVDDESTN